MGAIDITSRDKMEGESKVNIEEERRGEAEHMKGVRHLYDAGVTKVPGRYILPASERPHIVSCGDTTSTHNLKLPIIDLSLLHTPKRAMVLEALSLACKEFGFFQVVNHGIPNEVVQEMVEVSKRFFGMSYEERAKYMSSDLQSPVRYGTSFNQIRDRVFCWRDFLKLNCQPLDSVLPFWPSSPADLREKTIAYANGTKTLFMELMSAILESLGVDKKFLSEFDDGSHLMVVNCYPPCPEPNLTLGMPPHSDYGFLTLLLQDEVEGLQVQYKDEWVTIEPVPGAFVVNVGDHLEIFSNGIYKSILHRVLVNSLQNRISIASLHSMPVEKVIGPATELVSESTPKQFMDTDFAAFLEYISSTEFKKKNFLESRKLTCTREQRTEGQPC
ncbi:2-oxoglutarate (2OG) and Fe(II)-dependent oxygenase superfamily protein [Carex rostrata]